MAKGGWGTVYLGRKGGDGPGEGDELGAKPVIYYIILQK